MTVTYEELEGYPAFGISNGRFSGTRKFKIAWTDWPEFYGELFGKFRYVNGVATITIPSPFPGVAYTYPTDCTIESMGKITNGAQTSLALNVAQYAAALITVQYSFLPPPDSSISGRPTIPDGTILTYSSNLGVDILTVPGRKMEWANDGVDLPDDVPFGVRIPTEDMNLTFAHVPMIPTAARTFRGKTNAATFMGYPAECVLFHGASIHREFQLVSPPSTPEMYRLEYHFSVRQILDGGTYKGWNTAYRPEGDGAGHYWIAVQTVGTNVKPFPTADFTQLFTLA